MTKLPNSRTVLFFLGLFFASPAFFSLEEAQAKTKLDKVYLSTQGFLQGLEFSIRTGSSGSVTILLDGRYQFVWLKMSLSNTRLWLSPQGRLYVRRIKMGNNSQIKYDVKYRYVQIGSNTFSYDSLGRINQINNLRLTYQKNGTINTIAGYKIHQRFDGKILSIGSVSMSYSIVGRLKAIQKALVVYHPRGWIKGIGKARIYYQPFQGTQYLINKMTGKLPQGQLHIILNKQELLGLFQK